MALNLYENISLIFNHMHLNLKEKPVETDNRKTFASPMNKYQDIRGTNNKNGDFKYASINFSEGRRRADSIRQASIQATITVNKSYKSAKDVRGMRARVEGCIVTCRRGDFY